MTKITLYNSYLMVIWGEVLYLTHFFSPVFLFLMKNACDSVNSDKSTHVYFCETACLFCSALVAGHELVQHV